MTSLVMYLVLLLVQGGADGLRKLPAGSKRRDKHDDVTCVVIYLKDGESSSSGKALIKNLNSTEPERSPASLAQ